MPDQSSRARPPGRSVLNKTVIEHVARLLVTSPATTTASIASRFGLTEKGAEAYRAAAHKLMESGWTP